MIQAAVTDVISPAVAAEDPEALLGRYCLSFRISLDSSQPQASRAAIRAFCGLVVGLGVVLGLQELVDDSIQLSVLTLQGLDLGDQVRADGLITDLHTQTMLGVVLEQGVDPCGAVTGLFVGGVRADRSGTTPDRGAAGGVGDEHLLAEQLGDQAGVRGLGAASAGAGELKQRLVELRTLTETSETTPGMLSFLRMFSTQ